MNHLIAFEHTVARVYLPPLGGALAHRASFLASAPPVIFYGVHLAQCNYLGVCCSRDPYFEILGASL